MPVSLLVLPQEVQEPTAEGGRPTRRVDRNGELPLRRMHIVVEGVSGLDGVRAQVRRAVGDAVYLRWRRDRVVPQSGSGGCGVAGWADVMPPVLGLRGGRRPGMGWGGRMCRG